MSLTTDPNDPRLKEGKPEGQNPVYLVLSEDERAKGFVRPYRDAYQHVGIRPKYPLRDLTDDERARNANLGYVKYEEYPESESPLCGRYWTRAQLDSGCWTVTTMGRALSETYARQPDFYGATFCFRCNRHFPVGEFVWTADGQVVGS